MILLVQMLDKKYCQHCCHMTTVCSRAASYVDMNKDCLDELV